MTQRPRRSVLYMPGSNARALEKARSLPADAFIFDLEDAVLPAAKENARALVVAALQAGGYGRAECLLRVNGADTPWGDEDLAAAAVSGADGVVLPKVGCYMDVIRAIARLDAAGAPPDLAVWAMIETPAGVLAAAAIAAASPRLAGLIMGTSDLARDLHARPGRDRAPLLPALGLCVLAARAAGILILDGVHLNLADTVGFEAACRQGRDLGFDGKTLIHPSTIALANRVFTPADADSVQARRIIAAFDEAALRGEGLAVVDGRLIESLHAEEARRILALHQACIAADLQSGQDLPK